MTRDPLLKEIGTDGTITKVTRVTCVRCDCNWVTIDVQTRLKLVWKSGSQSASYKCGFILVNKAACNYAAQLTVNVYIHIVKYLSPLNVVIIEKRETTLRNYTNTTLNYKIKHCTTTLFKRPKVQ